MKRPYVSVSFCGHGFNKETSWYNQDYECAICYAVFSPPVALKEPELTLDEAIAKFDKIPLADKKASQQQAQKRRRAGGRAEWSGME